MNKSLLLAGILCISFSLFIGYLGFLSAMILPLIMGSICLSQITKG